MRKFLFIVLMVLTFPVGPICYIIIRAAARPKTREVAPG